MQSCDTLIRKAAVMDGGGAPAEWMDVGIADGRIVAIAPSLALHADSVVEADGLTLAPGFIDVHTHDDLYVIRRPEMLPKLSQGVTTVIVGNCGISAAPVELARGFSIWNVCGICGCGQWSAACGERGGAGGAHCIAQ